MNGSKSGKTPLVVSKKQKKLPPPLGRSSNLTSIYLRLVQPPASFWDLLFCFFRFHPLRFESNKLIMQWEYIGSIYFARRQDRFGTSECPEMMGKAWKTQSCYLPFFSNPAGGFPISPRDPFKGPWIIKGFFHHHHFEWRMDATKRTCGQWSDIHLNGLLTKRDKNIVKKLAPKKLDHFIYYTLY